MSIAPKQGIHEAIAASIAAHPATARIGKLLAIDRESAGQLLGAMREIAFPGFHLMGGAEGGAARNAHAGQEHRSIEAFVAERVPALQLGGFGRAMHANILKPLA